jgi:hypothetical protein
MRLMPKESIDMLACAIHPPPANGGTRKALRLFPGECLRYRGRKRRWIIDSDKLPGPGSADELGMCWQIGADHGSAHDECLGNRQPKRLEATAGNGKPGCTDAAQKLVPRHHRAYGHGILDLEGARQCGERIPTMFRVDPYYFHARVSSPLVGEACPRPNRGFLSFPRANSAHDKHDLTLTGPTDLPDIDAVRDHYDRKRKGRAHLACDVLRYASGEGTGWRHEPPPSSARQLCGALTRAHHVILVSANVLEVLKIEHRAWITRRCRIRREDHVSVTLRCERAEFSPEIRRP